MATKEMDSPLEARADRLKRKADRKSAKADRLEARGKTKRAAKKRGAAAVKTAKADKIAGKQDAKDAKQKGRQDKKMAKVEKRQDKKKSRKAKLKKVSVNNAKKAGKKALNTAGKKLVEKTGGPGMYGGKKGDESKSKRDYMGTAMYGGKKGDESKSRRDYEGTSMYGANKGDYHEHMDKEGHETKTGVVGGGKYGKGGHYKDYMKGTSMYDMSVPGEKLKYIQGSSSGKYDNVGGPSMSGEAYDDKMAYDKKLPAKERMHYMENAAHDKKGGPSMRGQGGSSMSKHFHRNRK
jgi:hypothetical protein